MRGYLNHRSLLTFTSFVFGFALLYNLINLSVKINSELIIYPYMSTMLVACVLCAIGFFMTNEKLLGVSTVMWLISIALNFAAVIFIVPIVILNILGRNRMLTRKEISEEKSE